MKENNTVISTCHMRERGRLKALFFAFLFILSPDMIFADFNDGLIISAESAYESAHIHCSGIADKIKSISNVSKINTAVTGVGTLASGGALYAGIKKSGEDARIEELMKKICDAGGCDAGRVESMSDADFFNNILQPMAEIAELQERTKKSKNLGNWRTGLMAGGAATNIASAIVAGTNKDQGDIIARAESCNVALANLRRIKMELHTARVSDTIVIRINNALSDCQDFNINDIKKIEKQMNIVMYSSIAGGATGTAGTITSAVANTDKTRNNDRESGKEKEKNLNTASNVLAGATTVASGVSTGFNISLINLTNKITKLAENCEKVFL